MLDLSLTRHFTASPSTLFAFGVFAVVAAAAAGLARQRRGRVLATGLSLSLVLAVTVPPETGWEALRTASWNATAAAHVLHPTWAALSAWHASSDGPLNVLLFAPLGLTLSLFTRRPIASAAVCGFLSLAIETYQAASGTRVGEFADVVSNGLGAAIGVGVALAVLAAPRLRPRRGVQRNSRDALSL